MSISETVRNRLASARHVPPEHAFRWKKEVVPNALATVLEASVRLNGELRAMRDVNSSPFSLRSLLIDNNRLSSHGGIKSKPLSAALVTAVQTAMETGLDGDSAFAGALSDILPGFLPENVFPADGQRVADLRTLIGATVGLRQSSPRLIEGQIGGTPIDLSRTTTNSGKTYLYGGSFGVGNNRYGLATNDTQDLYDTIGPLLTVVDWYKPPVLKEASAPALQSAGRRN